MFITVITTACHMPLSSAQVFQRIPSHRNYFRCTLSSLCHPSLIYHVVSILQVSHPKPPRLPVFRHTGHMFVHFLNLLLHRSKICFKTRGISSVTLWHRSKKMKKASDYRSKTAKTDQKLDTF